MARPDCTHRDIRIYRSLEPRTSVICFACNTSWDIDDCPYPLLAEILEYFGNAERFWESLHPGVQLDVNFDQL